MLPSTGYFNGINCPFYETGPCDRPYCHFRHARKDLQNTNNDSIESGALLQKLVSAAVQRVLQQTEVSMTTAPTQAATVNTIADINKTSAVCPSTRATYNPTPIAELNKINNTDAENNEDVNEQKRRHIPVPYTPRKPASLPLKRPVDTNGSSKPFIYNPPPLKYTPGSAEGATNDTYTPPGAVESKEKYLPGTEKQLPEYTPDPSTLDPANKRNYVPSSDKSVSKKKLLEYKPSNPTKTNIPSVTYQPTPRSLAPCFSSDEEEPEVKKIKLSSDLNGLDDLGPEFDILDQIFNDEEKNTDKTTIKIEQDESTQSESKHSTSESKEKNGDATKSEKDKNHRSYHKSKSDKKEKSSNEKERKHDKHKSSSSSEKDKKEDKHKISTSSEKDKKGDRHKRSSSKDKDKKEDKDSKESKDKKEDKHKSSDKKSSHKSSSRDKEKEKDDKHSKSKEKGSKDKDHKVSKDKQKHSSTSDKKRHSTKSCDESHKRSTSKSEKRSDSKRSSSDSKSKERRSKDKEKEKRHKTKYDENKKKTKKITADSSDNDDINNEENGHHEEEEYITSEDDEDTIALECKRIFEEYVPCEKPKNTDEVLTIEDNAEEEYIPGKKRVSRTVDKNIKIIPKAPVKPDFKVNAAQAMAERLAKVREYHSSRQPPPVSTPSVETPTVKTDVSKYTPTPTTTSSKIRIAHVPYASTMLNAKRPMPPPPAKTSAPSTSSTISQTVKKGAQRVAHLPNEKFIDRPGVLEPLASKIAANIRSVYLNMMIDECLKLYISATDAYARAQHEELNTSKKCSTVQIYKNSAVLAVSRLRKELQECNGVKKTAESCSVIGSSLKTNAGTWSIEGKNRKTADNSQEFVGAKFYKNISKWVLTEEQLQSNGYPRPHTNGEKGRAIIYGQNKQHPPKGYLRTCCRCKKEYMVNKKGFAAVTEECIYHPNRMFRFRGEAKYQCCSQDANSDGCCVAPSHVYEYVDFENLKGYVKTLPPERPMDDYGVYSLDCEMCYTTHGLDLTRVTVINSSCKVIYETLVRPFHPIIDYNTRYSGITEEQMSNVRTSLLEVQATLLAMFNSKTILVGHSLESDFKALKLIHDTVVDTSVLFPHKMGPPYKRALRNLSSEHLKKIIQNSVDGHDSAEDAMVCMELLHYKLKEDLKTR